jgi:prepilin-type N-terminal cleavage/methylation domain-containing protein
MNRRGFTLIDLMVAISLLGIGMFGWMEGSAHHAKASRRAIAIEGAARALDQELERLRACDTAVCLRALATNTATTAGVSNDAASWGRYEIHRRIEPGPGPGLHLATVTARIPGVVPERSVRALLWVKR